MSMTWTIITPDPKTHL